MRAFFSVSYSFYLIYEDNVFIGISILLLTFLKQSKAQATKQKTKKECIVYNLNQKIELYWFLVLIFEDFDNSIRSIFFDYLYKED